MKFLISKSLHDNPNFILLLGFYSFLLLFYFIGDLFYLGHFFGTTTQTVLSTIQGNEEEFLEPLSLMSLLEHLHIALFLGIMALFTTMAIVLRLNLTKGHKRIIITLSMGALLLESLALLGTYFFNENFVYLFFYGTITWHLVGVYALLLALKELYWTKRDF